MRQEKWTKFIVGVCSIAEKKDEEEEGEEEEGEFDTDATRTTQTVSRSGIYQMFLQFFYDFSTIFLRLFPARIYRLFRAKS
jgi:hypothetical protein